MKVLFKVLFSLVAVALFTACSSDDFDLGLLGGKWYTVQDDVADYGSTIFTFTPDASQRSGKVMVVVIQGFTGEPSDTIDCTYTVSGDGHLVITSTPAYVLHSNAAYAWDCTIVKLNQMAMAWRFPSLDGTQPTTVQLRRDTGFHTCD